MESNPYHFIPPFREYESRASASMYPYLSNGGMPYSLREQEHNLLHGNSSIQTNSRTVRSQKCSLCANHGIVENKKGHKQFCPYKDCQCDWCKITKGRQETMKNQQKLSRQLKRNELQEN